MNRVYIYIRSKWRTFQLLLLLCSCFPVFAQDPHPTFKHYTVEQGLASSEVYQVKQDSKGYLWFATGNGVSCFNGYEFENFSMKDGLPENTIFEIYEDPFERIWFVSLACKLAYYYKGKIYPFKHNDQIQKMIPNPLKTSFCIDKDGTIFLGLSRYGILQISRNGTFKHLFPTHTIYTVDVIEPKPNELIFSYYFCHSFRAVNFQTQTDHQRVTFPLKDSIRPLGGAGRIIRLKNNDYLMGFGPFLYRFDHANINQYTVESIPARIIWLYEDNENDIWIGTVYGGVYYLPKGDFKQKKCFLNGLAVNSVLQDKEGGFWFGTEGDGVYYSASKKIRTFDKSVGLSEDRIQSFATDQVNVFTASPDGMIHTLTTSGIISSYCTNEMLQEKNSLQTLFYDSREKTLWIGARKKSGRLQNGEFGRDKISVAFNDAIQDSAGVNWFVCSGGFYKYEHHTVLDYGFPERPYKQLKNGIRLCNDRLFFGKTDVSKSFKRLNAIAINNKGKMVAGGINGLWNYDTKEEELYYVGYKHHLLQNRILGLDFLDDSLLVIGTKGSGIILYNNKLPFQINSEKGLSGDNVYAVCHDSSAIWAATNKGVSKIVITDRASLKYAITNYTMMNGLPSNEINDIQMVHDIVWVASNKGATFFHKDSINTTNVDLPIYIDKIQINDRDTAILNNYKLDYNQNNIKVSYTGLGFKNSGQLSYRYKMIGLDTGWTYTKSREIQFTTLPANDYTLILNVMNTDKSWSQNEAVVHFKILLPFWKKWWFDLGCIVLGTYIMFLLVRFRLKRVEQRKEKISDLNKILMNLKLKALRAQMNPHFTFNVMNSIQHFIANNDGEAANRYLSRFSKLIRLILNNSEKNLVPIADEIKALELYLELEVMRFEERFEYIIKVDKSIDTLEMEIPSMLIQPYVENSIKHGILNLGRKGIISIDIQKHDKFLKCIIEDNGVGRSTSVFLNKNISHKSFGTAITQERLAAINALNNSTLSENVIDLYDDNGNPLGTRVEIFIPII